MGIGTLDKSRKVKLAFIIRTVLLLSNLAIYLLIDGTSKVTKFNFNNNHIAFSNNITEETFRQTNTRHLLALNNDLLNQTEQLSDVKNCTLPALDEFPSDGFTRSERQHGYLFVHIIISCYCFILLAEICEDYFVPAIRMMCNTLPLSDDVIGATIMAAASSSPELFINCVGTFITKNDLGVGTIVGSAVFNVLAVPACAGLFARKVIPLDWWPITRDCTMYGIAVMLLIGVLADGKVEWYEALLLVFVYSFYIFAMAFNDQIRFKIRKFVKRYQGRSPFEDITEIKPLLTKIQHDQKTDSIPMAICKSSSKSKITSVTINEYSPVDSLEDSMNEVFEFPTTTIFDKFYWILTFPITICLYVTIPNSRKHPKLLGLTFTMCIVWIAVISYLVAWMITTIGDTLDIPDSIMGLTMLAAGTSTPEAISSILVTNQGYGGMGISNSLGSNIFDILLCLGLPWSIKSFMNPQNYVQINSMGLSYSSIMLFSSLILLYLSFYFNKFKLDWKIGVTCLLIYLCFLIFASLIELNIFFPVNLPTCPR